MSNISLAIMVQNESTDLEKCLHFATANYDFEEIVVLDGGSTDTTIDVAKKYTKKVFRNNFVFNFSNQRNRLIELTTKDWILMLDADEMIEDEFYANLNLFIEHKEFDVFALPRKNYILDNNNMEKGWGQTDAYPDFQLRLFRRYCRWIYPCDEILVGWKRRYNLEYNILHYKTLMKQNYQWRKYKNIRIQTEGEFPYIEIIEWEKNNGNDKCVSDLQ